MKTKIFLVLFFLFFISSNFSHELSGTASWYGPKFHGRKTANGEKFNMYAFTAAHKTLPFNTYLKVTNLKNGKSVIVRVNDRGPFVKNRIIDLSYAAAHKIGVDISGTAPVKLTIIKYGKNDKLSNQTAKKASSSSYLVKKKENSFYVLVGTMGNKKNGMRLLKKIRRYFKNVSIVRGKKYYRVVLGPFGSKNSAKKALRNLKYFKYGGIVVNGSYIYR